MTTQHLKHALWILQRQISLGITQTFALIEPTLSFVGALLRIPTGEVAVAVVVRINVLVAENAGGVGVMNYVVAEKQIVLNHVPNEAAEKSDVGPHPNRD